MTFKKNSFRLMLVVALTMLTLSGCKKFEGDVTVPAYIHLDRIDVVPQSHNAPSAEAGFYNSDIEAVQFIAYFDGDDSETTLGTFQLPCTVPILREGPVKYLRAYPVVRQNGIASTYIYYFYYDPIELNDVVLTLTDTVNLGKYDADKQQYYLETNYKTRNEMDVLSEDYFEPTSFTTNFDSTVTWVTNDPEGACTGRGYGLVHVPDSETTLSFIIKKEFKPSTTGTVYLEMNYQTDMELRINMVGYEMTSTGTATTKGIMALNPTTGDEWKKIYINVTRTWGQFNYNTPFAIHFQAVNSDGIEGDIKLDNVKILFK